MVILKKKDIKPVKKKTERIDGIVVYYPGSVRLQVLTRVMTQLWMRIMVGVTNQIYDNIREKY